jgi:hypothetical protein
MKENVTEINGHRYRYGYDPEQKKTVYLGPVSDGPALTEAEFLKAMELSPQEQTAWALAGYLGKEDPWGLGQNPAILSGKMGHGRTQIGHLAAKKMGQDSIVYQAMGDGTDRDSLLGNWALFTGGRGYRKHKWVDGFLVDAMAKGKVLVIDDVHRLDDDLLGMIYESATGQIQFDTGPNPATGKEEFSFISPDRNYHVIGIVGEDGYDNVKEIWEDSEVFKAP